MPFKSSVGGYQGQVNGEDLKEASLVIPELVISQELSHLSNGTENKTTNFIRFLGAHVLIGRYPAEFLTAWDIYAAQKSTENQRPDTYSHDDQHFICVALSVGGQDLEAYKIRNEEEATSIILQSMLALMVAERALRFEHRDLHVGNVLIQDTAEERISFLLNGTSYTIRSFGIKVHLIDFSLSRIEKAGTTLFFDASKDPGLFNGDQGVLQFETYREMREHNRGNWMEFAPKTNSMWIRYLAHMVLTQANKKKKILKKRKLELQGIYDCLLNYATLKQYARH